MRFILKCSTQTILANSLISKAKKTRNSILSSAEAKFLFLLKTVCSLKLLIHERNCKNRRYTIFYSWEFTFNPFGVAGGYITGQARVHPWVTHHFAQGTYEHLQVQCLAQEYLSNALKASWHLSKLPVSSALGLEQ